jgi:hypothetical protein
MAKVNDVSAAVAAMQPKWAKIDALIGGTEAMRAAGEKYLPKFPAEDEESYKYRVATSTLFNGLARTLENMAAKPFAEAITYTDIDKVAEEWLTDIDQCGNNLTVFAHSLFVEGMAKGLTHILVEHPVALNDDGSLMYPTKAAEDAAGVRPYLVHIKPGQVLGWRTMKGANGAEVLAMLRFMECVEQPDGEFGTAAIEQIRVLVPGAWATYRKSTAPGVNKDEWLLDKQGTTTLDFIPLVTFYTKRTGFMTATPPLIDLADLNIKHWQSSSDQDSILHTARVPILAISGLNDEDKIEIGAKAFLRLPIGATAAYVEHTGAAIDAGRVSLQDLENQMRAMGAELLVEAQVASTATQNSIEDGEAKCQLARMVQGEEDALDNALDIMHTMKRMEYKGSIDIFDDFSSDAVLASAGPFIIALVQLVNNGLLDKESAFEEMQRYGILNPDLVWKDVQDKIDLEPPMFDVAMPGAPPAPAPTPAPAPAPATE